ncbi:MAG TPA: SigE family RNA polymerase sigma factor [Actinomycetota bacterium]|nr:SigE family RNA polymerase sigma factor [Actinomycetota bacterium]
MIGAVEVAERGRTEGGRLAELYRRHAPDAVRLAYLLTGDRVLAEDLVQDAFVKLAGRFRDLRDPDAFAAYLRRTVVNLTNSHWRRTRLERAHAEREGRRLRDAPVAAAGTEERDELWTALRRLPRRQRAAIVLRYYEDLSEARIAEVLGVRPGTVKSLVSRGMDALRAEVTR